jgi:hypothetical protein
MRKNAFLAVAVCVCIAWGALAAAEPTTRGAMGPRQEFAHAGIALCVPKGFTPQAVGGPFDVMRAVRMKGDRPVQAVTLTAYCVAEKTPPDAFADAMLADLKANLSFRRVEELKKTPMQVAGIAGAGRLVSYELRGQKTTAARVYFVRTLKPTNVPVCYVLTVEAADENKDDLLPILGEMVKTVALTNPQHPAPLPVKTLAAPVKDHRRGFSVRPPAGWYCAPSALGLQFGQADYLLGGTVVPVVNAMVLPVEAGETAAGCAKKTAETAKATAAEHGMVVKVLAEGPAKLGKLDGYQFILRQSVAPTPTTAPDKGKAKPNPKPPAAPPVLIVQRTACVFPKVKTPATTQPADGKNYSLVLITQGVEAKVASAMMDKIAAGFALLPPPKAPVPATKPTTKPTTKPAKPKGK